MFLFKKVRINSAKAKEKKRKNCLFLSDLVLKNIITREATQIVFSCYFNCCTMFDDFSSSFFPGHFLRPPEKKTGNKGPFSFLFPFWITCTTFIYIYIYIYICFFNQWHDDMVSQPKDPYDFDEMSWVLTRMFLKAVEGGTFKLANPTELSTELSVNQVDALSTIFSC